MIVAIWKPKGPTSHDIVHQIRKITGVQRVGHAGTLDPLAEGVLVVAIGRQATKKLQYIVSKEKEYTARIRLGTTSATDDAEGPLTDQAVLSWPKRPHVAEALALFQGSIRQIPPGFSAIKVAGRRAYQHARKGAMPLLKARPVEIKEIQLLQYRRPNLTIRVVTGPGVYIRALARDIGQQFDTGAYLSGLVRTRVGEFDEKNALTLAQFKRRWVCRRGIDIPV